MGRHALLVATGEYEDVRLSRLRAPEQDVERLAAVLEDSDVGGFTTVEVLRDRADHEIRRAVEDLLAPREADDLVLLYFSCHGLTTAARRLYFAASNTVQDRPAGTAIPRSFLNEQLEDCRASGRILLLDCCFSGAFVEGFKAAGTSVLDDVGTGYVVMTASNAYEYAFEQDSLSLDAPVASLFTDVLIEGLAGGAADLDGDGWIDVDELFKYAQAEVRGRRPDQTPQFFAHGSSQPLRIARAGGPPGRRPRGTASYTSGQLLVARGFRAAAEPVCRTLGPMGRRAVVFVDRRPVELADASAIVAAFQPDDPRNWLGAGYVRDLVLQVRRDAGDGAASAVAVARGAIGGLVEAMRDGHNPVRLMRGVTAAAARADELITDASVPVKPADVRVVATAAAGGAEIGGLVAEVVGKAGSGAPILVEEGRGIRLEYEVRSGLRLASGYASSLFVTDAERDEAVLVDARVLLVTGRLPTGIRAVLHRHFGVAGYVFVVCEELPHDALTELLLPGVHKVLAAVTDSDELNRLHATVGGTILDADLLQTANPHSFGRATKVVATSRETLVYGGLPQGDTTAGSISGDTKAGLIRVPAADLPKVERAVRAVRSAAHEGVLRGGGVGLADLGARLASDATGTAEEIAGWQAFAAALAEPARRIAENAAVTVADLDPDLLDSAGVARTVVTAAAHTTSRFLLVH
ncbi:MULTISPECIES: caspase, EACC1-associated type [Saccharothrix]|uniref:caspase, EACC1-associated type n=1 Tax=Saccharothrix TaxID=2071 RepID=UPI00093A7109|nr:TCP-1/cpn60 chaperonin family protein [Saccharothrix sp. CB00851]OKI18185.1 hypothetical protein A6A25_11490 [Saccharothrix sp. CB00851]